MTKLSMAEFLAFTKLDEATLELWILEEWIVPVAEATERQFTDADLARVLLIRDLIDELGVNEEGVGVVLKLIDQVHGLRRALAHVLSEKGLSS